MLREIKLYFALQVGEMKDNLFKIQCTGKNYSYNCKFGYHSSQHEHEFPERATSLENIDPVLSIANISHT